MSEVLSEQTYYDVLDVAPDAAQHQIVLAYENSKKLYSTENHEIFNYFTRSEIQSLVQLLDEAFEILVDAEKRKQYDLNLTGHTEAEEITQEDSTPEEEEEVQFSGAYLNKIRKEQGVSLADLSQATCVRKYYLEAIESEDYSALPAPVFVRGYIKHIAKTLGLDGTKASQSFMERMKSLG